MIGLGAIPTWGIIQQIVLGKPFGNNPMPDMGLIVFAIGVYVALFFFASIRLITRISTNEIHVHLFPLTRRLIEWREVETDWMEVDVGVRQGCVLSGLLFIVCVDDLLEELEGTGKGLRWGAGETDVMVAALICMRMIWRCWRGARMICWRC